MRFDRLVYATQLWASRITGRRHLYRLIGIILLSTLFVSMLIYAVTLWQAGKKFSALEISATEVESDFSLSDHNGLVRHLADFRGKVVVMFFGYTACPDVCPTSLSELVRVKELLGAKADKLQVLFVTVDPERDTAPMLKSYMENFDPTFLGLIPDREALVKVAKDFKIYYAKRPGPTATSYTMDHSAGSYVFDTQGRRRLFSKFGSSAQDMSRDIQTLLGETSWL